MDGFDDWEQILKILIEYKGRILGLLAGFFAAVLVITFGVISAVFIMMCMGIGYYLGQRYDNHKDIKDVINDILPPQNK